MEVVVYSVLVVVIAVLWTVRPFANEYLSKKFIK